eukprot:4619457-Pyramimonas_sp.AAC.1
MLNDDGLRGRSGRVTASATCARAASGGEQCRRSVHQLPDLRWPSGSSEPSSPWCKWPRDHAFLAVHSDRAGAGAARRLSGRA